MIKTAGRWAHCARGGPPGPAGTCCRPFLGLKRLWAWRLQRGSLGSQAPGEKSRWLCVEGKGWYPSPSLSGPTSGPVQHDKKETLRQPDTNSGKCGFSHSLIKNLPVNVGDIRDTSSIPGLGKFPRGGHDNPLQFSCLENPVDRGAWRATVHGVA